MRKSKLMVLSLLAASLAFGFQSCHKDDDDNDNNSSNTTQNPGNNDEKKDDSGIGNSVPPTKLPALDTDVMFGNKITTVLPDRALNLKIKASNPSQITVTVNGKDIFDKKDATSEIVAVPTSQSGDWTVIVTINDGQNEPKTENLSYRVLQVVESVPFTVNGVTFMMNKVYGGTFQMGATEEQLPKALDNEKPVHTLSSFYIGQTEVTQALWYAVMGANPSFFKLKDEDNNDINNSSLPVELVSWNDVQDFITKLNSMVTGGKTFRLPTEAEWEFAARGGLNSKGYKYSGSNDPDDVALYTKDVEGIRVTPVASKQANELGLYDMSGGVCEWCQDWYYLSYSSDAQTNPQGPSTGENRVYRGGSWDLNETICRVSWRSGNKPSQSFRDIGFRLALSINE
ncbi:MAG: formylglycine-generating enzyme family protein [Bacteroidales bacterium]|nr:formylglycine-generating enzyme family protein [Bacteroidales bacterium]